MEEKRFYTDQDYQPSKLPPPPIPESGQTPPPYNPYGKAPFPPKNKNTGCIIGSIALALFIILMIAGGVLYLISQKDNFESYDTSEKEVSSEPHKSLPSRDANENNKGESDNRGVRLYFCESYDETNDEESGVSSEFTPGWLTVMLDMRDAGKTINSRKAYLDIYKIEDADGNRITPVKYKTVEFNVQPDYNYIYFRDKDRLIFKAPGKYRVTLLNGRKEFVAENELKIIPKN